MRNSNSKGFTLIELIVVIVIMATLAAFIVPIYTSYIEKSRQSVCLANREELAREVYIEYSLGNYASLADCFTSVYTSHGSANICPSSGIYTWVSDTSTTGHVVCSYHDGTGSSGSSSSVYLGTTSVIQPSTWPTDNLFQNSWSSVSISPSGIFLHTDGDYYVVTKSVTLTKSQASSGPGGEVYNWFATQKLTGNIVTYSSNSEQKSTLSRGDICKVGNDYYVYIDGGSWAYGPNVSANQWYKLPS